MSSVNLLANTSWQRQSLFAQHGSALTQLKKSNENCQPWLVNATNPRYHDDTDPSIETNPTQASDSNDSKDQSIIGYHHVSVLSKEVLAVLDPQPGQTFVDCTLGGGGHSEALLAAGAAVIGIDQDPAAIAAATERLAVYGDSFTAVQQNFRHLPEILDQLGIEHIDGILADLGVSSTQLDQAERGFSFRHDGPLDMRMDPSTGISAAEWLNNSEQDEIARVLYEYGEERASRRIAKAIVAQRQLQAFERSSQLADLIAQCLPKTGAKHPATRSFQAIRIAINDELGALEDLLQAAPTYLKSGGTLAIITFHSLEDRIVKHFLKHRSCPSIDRPEWPAARPNPDYQFNLINRKATAPTNQEIQSNPRSRSSKLRAARRI